MSAPMTGNAEKMVVEGDMHAAPWAERLDRAGPKRVLSLDGGGVRGALTIGILHEMEHHLRRKFDRPDLVLSDYFDLIGGTSTGAIIAAGLALGRTTEDIEALYRHMGPSIFRRVLHRLPGFAARFNPLHLEKALVDQLGPGSMGDAPWVCGFCAVAKRVDTGSAWVISNSPRSKYWNGDPDETDLGVPDHQRGVTPNRDFPLAKVVQASAAAPFFFDLVKIEVERDKPGVFFDGAITPHGNPSLQLAMSALIPEYGFGWRAGEDELLIISVGTGAVRPRKPGWTTPPLLAIWKALQALMSVAYDNSQLAITLLQWLGATHDPVSINSEIGGVQNARPVGVKPFWSFQRYDAPLEPGWLSSVLGIACSKAEIDSLQKLDASDNIPKLFEIGRAAGKKLLKDEHFPAAFDL